MIRIFALPFHFSLNYHSLKFCDFFPLAVIRAMEGPRS